LIDSFTRGVRKGAYWATRSDIAKYPAAEVLPCPLPATQTLAGVPTRLAELDDRTQEQLINWGYAICDAAMRAYVVTDAGPPPAFPYPAAGV
jgi:NTE family protein